MLPTTNPSVNPTMLPTINPTVNPTMLPTANPTDYPTTTPSLLPTRHPSTVPSAPPSTSGPTSAPSVSPSVTQYHGITVRAGDITFTSAGGTVWINGVDLIGRLEELERVLAAHFNALQTGPPPTTTSEPGAFPNTSVDCFGGLHADRAFIGQQGAHLILNATSHGCVLLDGANVIARLLHVEQLLALL